MYFFVLYMISMRTMSIPLKRADSLSEGNFLIFRGLFVSIMPAKISCTLLGRVFSSSVLAFSSSRDRLTRGTGSGLVKGRGLIWML